MLVFIDESGHPRPKDSTKRPVLISACIRETDVKRITHDIYKIKMDLYGKQDEIKSTDLIRRQTITKNRTINKEYVDRLIDLVENYDINVFAVIMERPDFEPYIEDGILPKQYFYLLKRIELFCRTHNYPMALVIFDEKNEADDKKISIAFNNFLYKSALGKTFEKILEVPLFVSSGITPGVQLADIMAGIIRHYYENELDKREPVDEFEKWICRLYNIIKRKTENLKDPFKGFVEYGFFIMNKTTFPKSPDDIDRAT
ncbi:MAG: DUF3800 domain-containing protein [Clostridiales bacterium]|jgi:hypothetical protein|nr:DUF3800 domain-containing protein [Eubacteriales bacterium]MDH7567646.1 DUF3800 domain-containing protein [Clostridiales bacterium]